MWRRSALPYASLAFAAALLASLGLLAVLQYRWIGEVSRAERDRLRATLEAAAERFAADLDLEVTRAFTAFVLDPRAPAEAHEAQLRERWTRWIERAAHPHLVGELLLARRDQAGAFGLRRLRSAEGAFEPCDWPADLHRLGERLEQGPPWLRPSGPRPGPPPSLLGETLSLVVPVGSAGGHPELVIVRLDRSYLAGALLPELAERHFSGREDLEYDLAVVRREAPAEVIYRSDPALSAAAVQPPDASIGLLDVRPFAELRAAWREPLRARPGVRRRGEGGVVALGPGAPPAHPPHGGPPAHPPHAGPPPHGVGLRLHEAPYPRDPRGGAWQLLVRHRGGSLEAVVARARARNLALSLGVLSLLGLSVLLLAGSTRRAHALARQQIEFVAGVTHELHTPLAGIRSAAQNLKDGVVSEPAQVRRYGGLIEKEGRRLSDTLEQVLEFAGIHTGRRVFRKGRVDLQALVEEALASCRFLIEEKDVGVETDVGRELPALDADPDALRAALRNLIANAAKYGGGWLRVSVAPAAGGAALEVRVEDRGPGIAEADRPHIFKPFYRGRDAGTRTAPGSGLGLSIVREVVEAHGGSVEVRARSQGGSCFTLRLPAAAAAATAADAAEAAP